MSEERRRILEMLAAGKITAEEAEKLLDAIGESGAAEQVKGDAPKGKPKFLRIMVEPKSDRSNKEKVNMRIPLQVVRAGVKLSSILPDGAKEKLSTKLQDKGISINVNDINSECLESIVNSLSEMSIDVDDEKERVRIFCE